MNGGHKILLLVLALIAVCAAVLDGCWYKNYTPETTTLTLATPVIVTENQLPTTIEKTSTKTVVITSTTIEPIYVRIPVHQFPNLETLKAFIDYWNTHKILSFIVSENGTGDFTAVENNCQSMAKQCQDMAAAQGYDFPTEVLSCQEMARIYGYWPDRPHMINKATIGAHCWYYDFNTNLLWQEW